MAKEIDICYLTRLCIILMCIYKFKNKIIYAFSILCINVCMHICVCEHGINMLRMNFAFIKVNMCMLICICIYMCMYVFYLNVHGMFLCICI